MNSSEFSLMMETQAICISDGATGTNLIERGLPQGKTGEFWVLEKPEAIITLHQDFIENGAFIILTNSFGGSRIRLDHSGLGNRFIEINKKAVHLARQAAKGADTIIAGSMGPLGSMLEPYGTIKVEDAIGQYRDQAEILANEGVDVLLIETQFDLNEAKAAIEGAQKVSDLPIICSFSFDRGKKTMMGVSPIQMAESLANIGLSMIGINCGKSLQDNLDCLIELKSISTLPIWFKPNAGLPKINEQGQPYYEINPDQMGELVPSWLENGAKVVGGCCGTTPAHLRAIAKAVQEQKSP